MEGNRHYLLIDEAGRILAGWSDGPFPDRDTSGAVLLREDGGYQFRLFPGGEENPPLTDETGAHLWRYENGQVRAGTAGELAAERAEIEANTPRAERPGSRLTGKRSHFGGMPCRDGGRRLCVG